MSLFIYLIGVVIAIPLMCFIHHKVCGFTKRFDILMSIVTGIFSWITIFCGLLLWAFCSLNFNSDFWQKKIY